MKNTLETKRLVNGLKSRIEKTNNQWTGKRTYINLSDREKSGKMKSPRNAQRCNKPSSICVIRFRGEENRGGRSEKVLSDTMNENILQVAKNINLWLQETEQIPISINPKKSLPIQSLSWTDLLWKNALRNLSRQKRNSRNQNPETQ